MVLVFPCLVPESQGGRHRAQHLTSIPGPGDPGILGTALESLVEITEVLVPVLPWEKEPEKSLGPPGWPVLDRAPIHTRPSVSNSRPSQRESSALRDRCRA